MVVAHAFNPSNQDNLEAQAEVSLVYKSEFHDASLSQNKTNRIKITTPKELEPIWVGWSKGMITSVPHIHLRLFFFF